MRFHISAPMKTRPDRKLAFADQEFPWRLYLLRWEDGQEIAYEIERFRTADEARVAKDWYDERRQQDPATLDQVLMEIAL